MRPTSRVPLHMKSTASLAIALLFQTALHAATDLWDLPPLRWSETPSSDPVAKLARELEAGRRIEGMQPLDRLRLILRQLEVPEESQILVFSKTSKQNALIHPGNPRCLFFNEKAYVGYVPGGDIEVIALDPLLGPVFHLVRGGGSEPMTIARDTSDCLSCHGTARTASVPGVLVRSVFPDPSGRPLLTLGSFDIDHRSPVRERWGGYYVTGRSSLPHLGNRTWREEDARNLPETAVQLDTVQGKVDTTRYPRDTSDVVALMVLEHQCHLHNELTAATVNHRRVHWLQQSLDPSADPGEGAAGKQAEDAAARIVPLLLFENEADPGADGIEGDPAFQEAFVKRCPRARDGRSLADFQLNDRLFKHRCSYMVYSPAFAALPARVHLAVLRRLHHVLTSPPGPDTAPDLKPSERNRILSILADTLPGWPPAPA
jgi:hypothetical protein